MKQSQNIRLYTATLIAAKAFIPAKAGIQEDTGFPRIKYPVSSTGQAMAGLVKPGMTSCLRLLSPYIILTLIATSILLRIALIEPTAVYGQSTGRMGISRETGRDPFVLPPGIRLFSKKEDTNSLAKGTAPSGAIPTTEIKSMDIPLKVTAILVSDHTRLASIDGYIATVGDFIHDEKILEIKNDRVVMGKGDKKRTLFLSQSPVQLTVEGK